MYISKTNIIFALLFILATLYAVNIFYTRSVASVLVEKPVKLSFIIVEPPKEKCDGCFDATNILKMIDTAHNVKYKTSNVPYDSVLSRKYIEMYAIKNLPAVIVSGDIENEKVASAWNALSGEKREGRVVIENLLPYYDIESAEAKGIISAVLIKDKLCQDCFAEDEYIKILKRFGLSVKETSVYDVTSTEGDALVKKYDISKVPTVLLSPSTAEYAAFKTAWSEVGTIENDGWFIFREVQKLNLKYKNI